MIYGVSFWLWIGYDTDKKTCLYEMGENISDLLIQMEIQDFFEDRDIELTTRLKNKKMTLEEMIATLKPGETWDDTERKANLKPLTTWEIVNLISYQIKPRYQQIKLLEIIPDNAAVFDYSMDRDETKDMTLESQSELLIETTLLTQSEKIQFISRGAEVTIRQIYNVFREKHMEFLDQLESIEFTLRYLHTGDGRRINLDGVTMFVEALRG